MVLQRHLFYQNGVGLGRRDSLADNFSERIDYAGDSSVGAAENSDAVFDGTERRGGQVLGWRRGAYKPRIVGQNSHDVSALRHKLAKEIGGHRLETDGNTDFGILHPGEW